MGTTIPSFLIALLLLGPIATMAQLHPEILADSYLLRVEPAIRDGDKGRAGAEIDKIILLQKEQELQLSEEFHFRYARAAAAVDRPDQKGEVVPDFWTRG